MLSQSTKPGLFLPILAVSAGVALQLARGEQAHDTGALHVHQSARSWIEPYDPTLLSRRLLTQFEYEDREAGDANLKWLWNLRWAVPLTDDLALGLQLEAPLRWVDESGEEDIGFGDLETRAGLAGRFTDRTRWGLVMNAKFPTASSDALGDGLIELRPIAALRWEATPWVELGANVEYNFTPRDEGVDRVSALEMKAPVVVKLAERLSAFTSYNPRWNDVTASWRHRLELGLTRVFGPQNEYALSIGAEVPLSDETFEWKANVGLSCYFK